MSPSSALAEPDPPRRRIRALAPVPTARPRTADLPAPGPLVEALARAFVEILAGARQLEQVARWVDDDVYRHLENRVALAARARAATGRRPVRPAVRLGRALLSEAREGVVDAVVVAHSQGRSRAVAIRLEGRDRRWRASAVHVL